MNIKNASGPQLNQIRSEFNDRVEAKSIIGKTKRVAWNNYRRYSSI